MNTEKHPYEFLVRWDENGVFAGAHVQFSLVTRDDNNEVIGRAVSTAIPVAMTGESTGVPIADIIGDVAAAAVAEANAARAELAAKVAELEAKTAEAEALATAKTAAEEKLAEVSNMVASAAASVAAIVEA